MSPMNTPHELPQLLKKRPQNHFMALFVKTAFLILGFIAVAVAVSWAFGWIAVERLDSAELFHQTSTGRKEMRSLAAMEWVKKLQQYSEGGQSEAYAKLAPTQAQAESLLWELENFKKVREINAPLLTAVAALVGYAPPSEKVRAVLRKFLSELSAEEMPEARIAAMLSLLRSPQKSNDDVKLFLDQTQNPDPSVRKAAAFGVGEYAKLNSSPELLESLKLLLADNAEDVRWNAAFALARLKDPSGLVVLRGLFAKAESQGANDVTLNDLRVYQEVFRSAVLLGDVDLLQQLSNLSVRHPNLKVRQLAKDWVAKK